ncbi:hypothetical protein D3C71_22900 [compost metagenome]
MLFSTKKASDKPASAGSPDGDFTLFVTRSTDKDGQESVSEVLMPERGRDNGSRGLFIRKPREITEQAADGGGPVLPEASTAGPEGQPASSPLKLRPFRAPGADSEVVDVEPVEVREPTQPASMPHEPHVVSEPAAEPAVEPAGPSALFVRKAAAADTVAAPVTAKTSFLSRIGLGAKGASKRSGKPEPREPELASDHASVAEAAVAESTSPVGASAGGSSLRGLFGARKKSAAAPDVAPAVAADKPAKASKPAKPAKAGKRPARARSGKGVLTVQVRLDNEQVYFNVTNEGLAPVEESGVASAASFSRDDRRFTVKPKTTYQQCVELALAEGVSEEVRVINEAKRFGCMYATAFERVEELSHDVGPGLRLLESVLEKEGRPTEPFVVCLLLQDVATARSLAVLYHGDSQGEIGDPQVTMNPHNLGFTLAQFQSARGLPQECPVIQITNADLVAVAHELHVYPREALWRGVPVSKLLWSAVGAVGVAAVAVSLYAGQQKLELDSVRALTAKHKATTQRYDRRNDELIGSSLVSFAKSQSLEVARLTERAASLWVPRSVLTVDATAARETYTVSMTMTGGAFFNNRPSVINQLQAENVQQLLKLTPPEGCFKSMPGVSGGVNVIQISVSCESPAGSTARYRLD